MGSKLIIPQVQGVSVYCNGDYEPSSAQGSQTFLILISQETKKRAVLLFCHLNKQTFPGLLAQKHFYI